MSAKKEFGDFQTPDYLAKEVANIVATICGTPDLVVEPTSGRGSFLKAAFDQWGENCRYDGYEINPKHIEFASKALASEKFNFSHSNFFAENWKKNLNQNDFNRVLVLGNPPWITNAALSTLQSHNLPKKTNFQNLSGFDALTGKSNFDIAEWILIKLIEALPSNGHIAMLCKTMTARKVLRHFWRTDGGREESYLFRIDARAAFNVSVDACLFITSGRISNIRTAIVHKQLDLNSQSTQFGYFDGDLVSDIETYNQFKHLNGGTTTHKWRSGIKHDASKIMELNYEGATQYRNGFGESVLLEDEYVYPLLKSSDLGNGQAYPRKYVLVPQKSIQEDTSTLATTAPNTWSYLISHKELLDKRKSSIYKNRPQFSIFGIGRYSFAPWKVAISGLYKSINFVVVPPLNGRPILVDDTCYSIPCNSEDEANLIHELLSSEPAKQFISSLIFVDSKRPITINVLKRLSLVSLAQYFGKLNELKKFHYSGMLYEGEEKQLSFVMEQESTYQPNI